MAYYYVTIKMAKIKNTSNTEGWPGLRETEFLIHSW